jgi:serine O-acetyltransferase
MTKRKAPPLPKGSKNMNPPEISFFDLIREDFRTHDSSLLEPGFWAVAVHRLGNWRMSFKSKIVRIPLKIFYLITYTWVLWIWGIQISYIVQLGRRVRLWHHGGMVLEARSIGDDVHIRQNTTFGIASRSDLNAKPMIGNNVDIGVGACLIGHITIGNDSIIGANAVVTKDVPPNSLAVGVPAKIKKSNKVKLEYDMSGLN